MLMPDLATFFLKIHLFTFFSDYKLRNEYENINTNAEIFSASVRLKSER